MEAFLTLFWEFFDSYFTYLAAFFNTDLGLINRASISSSIISPSELLGSSESL